MGEEGAGAAAADGDFVADQVDVVAVAEGARQAQVFRVVHDHAVGALDERFDDQRGDVLAMLFEMRRQRGGGAAGNVGRRFAIPSLPRVGRRQGRRAAHQRRVGFLENIHVGHGQRADRFAVVTAGQAEKLVFLRKAAIAPTVERHFQRDFRGRGAVGGEEAMSQRMVRQGCQAFGKGDDGLVGEAGENDVLQGVELGAQRGVDARIGVAEQVDPPRADGVEIALAVEVVQPGALAARDGDERQCARVGINVLFHLGAGMPDGGKAALQEFGIVHGVLVDG